MTVTGTASPSVSKIRVMPNFLPIKPPGIVSLQFSVFSCQLSVIVELMNLCFRPATDH